MLTADDAISLSACTLRTTVMRTTPPAPSLLRFAVWLLGLAATAAIGWPEVFPGGSPAMAQSPTQAAAGLTEAQRGWVAEVVQQIRQAGTFYQAGEFDKAGEQIDLAVAGVARLVESGDVAAYDAIAPLFSRIINAHALLELEGIELTPFQRPQRPVQAGDASGSPTATMQRDAALGNAEPGDSEMGNRRSRRDRPGRSRADDRRKPEQDLGPSFVREVAPILVQRCGACHIQEARGEFSVANFALLARGTPAGAVVFPGDLVASRLIESIETGDMPRGDQQVSPAELQTLKDWVMTGARFDGPSPLVPMVAMAASAAAANNAATNGAAAGGTPRRGAGGAMAGGAGTAMTGNQPAGGSPAGTVSFAKDIAPILLQHCSGCHIDANMVRGGLRLDTFAQLLRGGDGGTIVEAGDPDGSSLIRRLRGEDEPRMPAGRAALSEQQISLIAKWIEEGVSLDAANPDQPLRRMATEAWASAADDQQLTARRHELARQNMSLAGVGISEVFELEDKRFLVLGNTNQATAEKVLEAAQKISKRLQSKLDVESMRGRTTIFVMPRRYDYSEFAKMVEQRSIPNSWQAHWRSDAGDAYLVVLGAASDQVEDFETRLTAPLASLAVATLGRDVPTWFAEGIGRNESVAARGRHGGEELAQWNAAVPAAARAMTNGAQVSSGELAPEQVEAIGYGAVAAMQQAQRRQLTALLKNLGKGPFESVFAEAFGRTPTEYLEQWKPVAGLGLERRR